MHRDSSTCLSHPCRLKVNTFLSVTCCRRVPVQPPSTGQVSWCHCTTEPALHRARAPALQSCRSQPQSTEHFSPCSVHHQEQTALGAFPHTLLLMHYTAPHPVTLSLFMLCLHTKKQNQALMLVGILFCWTMQWILWKGVTISTTVDWIRIIQELHYMLRQYHGWQSFFFLQKTMKGVIINFADIERNWKKHQNNSPLRKTLLKSNPWFAKKSILELCNKRKTLYNWQKWLWHKKSVIFTLFRKLYKAKNNQKQLGV